MAAPAGTFSLAADGEARLVASGPLTFATARSARELAEQLLGAGRGPLTIDCAGISASDSAGLAALLDFLATARRAQRSLRYTGLPAELITLARISEVDELLARGV